ncbi:MAG: twin-arginine translocase TatA/TatE family subunit [Thermoanaerobaculia bacterium]
MGPLGFQEILIILGLALLIFGPRELPKIGRTIGRAMGEFRKATTELKRSLNVELIQEELRESDPRKLVRETAKELETAAMAEDAEDSETEQEPAITKSPAAPEPDSPDSPAGAEAADGSAPVPRESPATAGGS